MAEKLKKKKKHTQQSSSSSKNVGKAWLVGLLIMSVFALSLAAALGIAVYSFGMVLTSPLILAFAGVTAGVWAIGAAIGFGLNAFLKTNKKQVASAKVATISPISVDKPSPEWNAQKAQAQEQESVKKINDLIKELTDTVEAYRKLVVPLEQRPMEKQKLETKLYAIAGNIIDILDISLSQRQFNLFQKELAILADSPYIAIFFEASEEKPMSLFSKFLKTGADTTYILSLIENEFQKLDHRSKDKWFFDCVVSSIMNAGDFQLLSTMLSKPIFKNSVKNYFNTRVYKTYGNTPFMDFLKAQGNNLSVDNLKQLFNMGLIDLSLQNKEVKNLWGKTPPNEATTPFQILIACSKECAAQTDEQKHYWALAKCLLDYGVGEYYGYLGEYQKLENSINSAPKMVTQAQDPIVADFKKWLAEQPKADASLATVPKPTS